ncbi:hypothetical protein FKM82_000050 [Ascaphus truei]
MLIIPTVLKQNNGGWAGQLTRQPEVRGRGRPLTPVTIPLCIHLPLPFLKPLALSYYSHPLWAYEWGEGGEEEHRSHWRPKSIAPALLSFHSFANKN